MSTLAVQKDVAWHLQIDAARVQKFDNIQVTSLCSNVDWGGAILICGGKAHAKAMKKAHNWQMAKLTGRIEWSGAVTRKCGWIRTVLQQ